MKTTQRITIHRHCWKKVHKIRKPYTTFKGNLSKASKDILLHNLAKVLQYFCVCVCVFEGAGEKGGGGGGGGTLTTTSVKLGTSLDTFKLGSCRLINTFKNCT